MIRTIRKHLKALADPQRAKDLQRFFKTGPGDYAEGDRFHGLTMPVLRTLSKRYADLALVQVEKLLHGGYHEERMLALLILVLQFRRGESQARRNIYQLYMRSTAYINNWDLVDVTCPHIMGAWLSSRSRRPLYRLARSTSLWERRLSIISTFWFFKQNDFEDTLAIADILLHDEHDLIHKAVGWALREVGNRELPLEEAFLQRHYKAMPRTMLRYAIEKFPEPRRQAYLKGCV